MTRDELEFWLYSAAVGILIVGGGMFYYASGKATPVSMMAIAMMIMMYFGLAAAVREADRDGSRGEEVSVR